VPDHGLSVLDLLRGDVVVAGLAGRPHVGVADRIDRELDVRAGQWRAIRPFHAGPELDGDVHMAVVNLLHHAVVRARHVGDRVGYRLFFFVRGPEADATRARVR